MSAYYNENDPKTAAWLRELIKAGLIADGEVDERSIADVQWGDVWRFTQCHFFAGIGGWSYALRLAGWPDGRRVWTGSCPCQPFSSAGAQVGGDDPRHLWPAWFRLIRECGPVVVFGEQVESAIGHGWIDLVCDDLEGEGYAIGACGLPAPSIGAFHNRARLWFVADSGREQCDRERLRLLIGEPRQDNAEVGRRREAGPLDDSERLRAGRGTGSKGRQERPSQSAGKDERSRVIQALNPSPTRYVGHANGAGYAVRARQCRDDGSSTGQVTGQATIEASTTRGAWTDAEWIDCSDGKARPVEPGTFPLAHGIPARVGRLRGYGNAIVPPLAAEFIKAYREAIGEDLHGL